MWGLRRILLDRARVALLLVAVALAMKALVPGGYMVGAGSQVLTIAICGDATGARLVRQIVVPHHQDHQDPAAQHAKADACPFSALAMAGTPGADPILLGFALAFILALAFVPTTPPVLPGRDHVRPPLRGPPQIA